MGAEPQARSPQLLMIDRHAVADGPRTWTVRQIIDTLNIRDFAIMASVDPPRLRRRQRAGHPHRIVRTSQHRVLRRQTAASCRLRCLACASAATSPAA